MPQYLSGRLTAQALELLKGRGPKDYERARKMLEKAYSEGEYNAGVFLAHMLAEGDGGPKDIVRARSLLEEALTASGNSNVTVMTDLRS